ncbi:MAG: hypothetical protein ACFFAO_14520 [Candidatus Hermodarchaeota archaeon]
MSSDSNITIENDILTCPFSQSCSLPKNKSICSFPHYKHCPDYEVRLQKLKADVKILH